MVKTLFIQLSLFLVSFSVAEASPIVAKITKTRGKVSILVRGSKVARMVKVGDKVREDSSILTGNKSFARLVFLSDNTVLNVGPRSKVRVINTKKDGTSFLHLLKGTIRTKVNKAESEQSRHKLYLKTRSAAMAVRGTEFQAVYNPDNNVSSLLTYRGEVNMAKVEEDPAAEVKRLKKLRRKQLAEMKVETNASGDYEFIQQKPKFNLEGRMDQALASNEAVTVKQGQYSGTVNTLKKASLPVKVSPVQLNALYKNEEMDEKLRRSEVQARDLKPEGNFAIKPAEQEPPAEGIFDEKTGEFAPRSGGVLDMNTGLYIPPEDTAVFDGKLKVFVPSEKSGAIDKTTGQYVAPKGMKLDPTKGFLPRKKEDQVLLAQAKSLNDATKPKLWTGNEAGKVVAPVAKQFSETEKIAKDLIEIELYGYGESFESSNEVNGPTGSTNNRKFDSEDAKRMLIRWSHNSESRWQPITSIGWKTTDYGNNTGGVAQPTRDSVMLGLGVRYNLSRRWNAISELLMEQDYYIDQENSALLLKRVAVPKLKFGVEGALFKTGKFSFDSHLYLIAVLPKESGNHEVNFGFGYGLDLLPRWWLNRKWTVYTGFSLQNQSQSVSNSGFEADNSHAKAGFKLGLGYLF